MIILEDKGRGTKIQFASFDFPKLDLFPILDLRMDVKVGIRRRGTYGRKELKSLKVHLMEIPLRTVHTTIANIVCESFDEECVHYVHYLVQYSSPLLTQFSSFFINLFFTLTNRIICIQGTPGRGSKQISIKQMNKKKFKVP